MEGVEFFDSLHLVIASASEAIQNLSAERFWIASSQRLLAMTTRREKGEKETPTPAACSQAAPRGPALQA